ncbi:MAG: ribulose-phosphate 3-epimerase [Clostridiaceae bacterium]|nr:ribulose-phosphate 3-epimerase [Clostridiaceae bacterium]
MKKSLDWTDRKSLLCPSILAADLSDLSKSVAALNDNYDLLHCDVMDGSFVPLITFGSQMVKQLSAKIDKALDVHLMVENPERQIQNFVDAGASSLVFHREASLHPQRVLSEIRSLGCYAGISLSPATPLEDVKYLLPDLDLLLLMTVNPGFGGQVYLRQMTEKIRSARAMIDASGYSVRLQVDGGISRDNLGEVMRAGADMVVAGSAIFLADDPGLEAKAFQLDMQELDRELKRV